MQKFGKTVTNLRSKTNRLTFREQDEIEVVSQKGKIPELKSNSPTEKDGRRNVVLSDKTHTYDHPSEDNPILHQPKMETARATANKQPIESENLALPRIGKGTIEVLQTRQDKAQMALDGISQALKKYNAIKNVVVTLEQQVQDCSSGIHIVKRFMYAAQTVSLKNADLKARNSLVHLFKRIHLTSPGIVHFGFASAESSRGTGS